MSFFVMFEDELPDEAVALHTSGGYTSLQLAIKAVNDVEDEGTKYQVIDRNGNVLYNGEAKREPVNVEQRSKGFELIKAMTLFGSSGKSYMHLLPRLKPILKDQPDIKLFIERLHELTEEE